MKNYHGSQEYPRDIEKTVGKWKDIESDFYTNDSPNDDLESEI